MSDGADIVAEANFDPILPAGDVLGPAEIRAAAAAAWSAEKPPGYLCFNTHHEIYEARLSDTRWEIMPPHLVEMSDAQLARWWRRLQQMRRMARALPAPP